jgi:hypothetical protein
MGNIPKLFLITVKISGKFQKMKKNKRNFEKSSHARIHLNWPQGATGIFKK